MRGTHSQLKSAPHRESPMPVLALFHCKLRSEQVIMLTTTLASSQAVRCAHKMPKLEMEFRS
eukprot:5580276-Amphidinium_carterae.1